MISSKIWLITNSPSLISVSDVKVSFWTLSNAAGSVILSCSSLSSMFVIDLEYLSVNTVIFFLVIASSLPSRTWLTADSPSSSFVSEVERGVLLVQQKMSDFFFVTYFITTCDLSFEIEDFIFSSYMYSKNVDKQPFSVTWHFMTKKVYHFFVVLKELACSFVCNV